MEQLFLQLSRIGHEVFVLCPDVDSFLNSVLHSAFLIIFQVQVKWLSNMAALIWFLHLLNIIQVRIWQNIQGWLAIAQVAVHSKFLLTKQCSCWLLIAESKEDIGHIYSRFLNMLLPKCILSFLDALSLFAESKDIQYGILGKKIIMISKC